MRVRFKLFVVLLLLIGVGCGGTSRQSVTPTKQVELKKVLNELADTGDLEQAKEVITTQIEKLEESDAAKAKELSAEFTLLLKSDNPAKVKEQARKMAAKL